MQPRLFNAQMGTLVIIAVTVTNIYTNELTVSQTGAVELNHLST